MESVIPWPRPLNDWVLVRMDPLPETLGSIILPNKGKVRTAVVLAVGAGAEVSISYTEPEKKRFFPTDVQVGEKIAFLRWATENQQGRSVSSAFEEFGENIALIKERDILFVMEISSDEKVELSV